MSFREDALFYTSVVLTGAAVGAYICMDGDGLQGVQYGAGITGVAVGMYLATSMLYHIALEALKISFAIAISAAAALAFMPQSWCNIIKTVPSDKFVDMVVSAGINTTAIEKFLCGGRG